MANKIWKMCVVGIMLASPAVCTATIQDDIAAAVAADDQRYVDMVGYGTSIKLDFPGIYNSTSGDYDPYPWNTPFTLKFADTPNTGMLVEFFVVVGTTESKLGEKVVNGPGQNVFEITVEAAEDECFGSWNRLKITVYDFESVLHLDAVQVVDASGPYGIYVLDSATGSITPLTDNPADVIADLVNKVWAVNQAQGLPNGIGNSLEVKLQNAVDALEDAKKNSCVSAANKLQAFINEALDQASEQVITTAQANALINGVEDSDDPLFELLGFFVGAEDIIELLCPTP
jgi:hypothetical protein